MNITLTKRLIESGLSRNGGYSARQVEALGEDLTHKGWKKRLIGLIVEKEDYDKFLALKDLSKRENYKQMRLF